MGDPYFLVSALVVTVALAGVTVWKRPPQVRWYVISGLVVLGFWLGYATTALWEQGRHWW
jgi:hypothetical protein